MFPTSLKAPTVGTLPPASMQSCPLATLPAWMQVLRIRQEQE